MTYQPTHVSREDGSPAMMTHHNEALCIMENENGDRWPDLYKDWQPIRIKPDPFEAGPIVLHHISEYEAERWRAMCDELTGQSDRLKQLCQGGTKAEWAAIACIDTAARSLWGAFGAIIMEHRDGNT